MFLRWNFLWRHSTVCWSWEQWDVHNSKLLGLETYMYIDILYCYLSLSYMMVMIWFCLIIEVTNKFTKSFSNGLKPNRWQKFFLLSVLLFNLRWLHVRLGRPGPAPNMAANNIRYTANHCPSRKYMDAKNFVWKSPPFQSKALNHPKETCVLLKILKSPRKPILPKHDLQMPINPAVTENV